MDVKPPQTKAQQEQADTHVDGVVIGLLLGFEDGKPLVVFPGNPADAALTARSLCQLSPNDAGGEVALLFEDGARDRPLIVGRIVEPIKTPDAPEMQVISDGQTLKVTSEQRIELRVGKSAIVMEADGHITIRGKHLVSQASGSNRIRGASVNLN
ncbi:hypothetical protein SAMN06265373_11087 [Shimia sagamensis]|uniref:DUF6484 domain-containing protein n=1 Tax=Shimia sagamensis TaxID=1566352 RepID=A0ABY1PHS2_9RHOB|nr:hypothetical protein SAMN06265373_11087 [Shimia sagamensis]